MLGAPGCARSPKENGFDWVLDRLIAGIDVSDVDIAGMGVGGLLMEIPTRPQPREMRPRQRADARRCHRAGRRPIEPHGRAEQAAGAVRRRAAGAAHRRDARWPAGLRAVVVVTGHQDERVAAALAGLDVRRSPTIRD